MHNKSFFQGLGLGLVIASVLFLILYSTRPVNDKPTNEVLQTAEEPSETTSSILDLPDGEAETEEPLGEVGNIEGKVGEISDIDIPPDPVMEELEPVDGISSEIAPVEGRDISIPSLSDNSNAEILTAENEAVSADTETVQVTIKSGDRASEICHKLYVAGAIDSEKGFSDFMRNNGYSRKVLYGSFEIPKGASYREVYDIIKSH